MKAWRDMNRQHGTIRSLQPSQTAPMSLFQVFTQERTSDRKWCAHTGCGICSSDYLERPMLFFFLLSFSGFLTNTQKQSNTWAGYTPSVLSSSMCSIPNTRPLRTGWSSQTSNKTLFFHKLHLVPATFYTSSCRDYRSSTPLSQLIRVKSMNLRELLKFCATQMNVAFYLELLRNLAILT